MLLAREVKTLKQTSTRIVNVQKIIFYSDYLEEDLVSAHDGVWNHV